MRLRIGSALICLLTTLAGPAAVARDWYAERGVRAPKDDRVYICHGYGCRIVSKVSLSRADLDRITAPLRAEPPDPEAERAAISRAVQAFEQLVGARVGTAGDLPGMQFGRPGSDQMDCIDEATNTTSLLRVLEGRNLLKHHQTAEPVARGFFLDGRYPHVTAVLREKTGATSWAIDSWPGANGEPPKIQRLRDWKADRSASSS